MTVSSRLPTPDDSSSIKGEIRQEQANQSRVGGQVGQVRGHSVNMGAGLKQIYDRLMSRTSFAPPAESAGHLSENHKGSKTESPSYRISYIYSTNVETPKRPPVPSVYAGKVESEEAKEIQEQKDLNALLKEFDDIEDTILASRQSLELDDTFDETLSPFDDAFKATEESINDSVNTPFDAVKENVFDEALSPFDDAFEATENSIRERANAQSESHIEQPTASTLRNVQNEAIDKKEEVEVTARDKKFQEMENLISQLGKKTKIHLGKDGELKLKTRHKVRIGSFFESGKSKKARKALKKILDEVGGSMSEGKYTYTNKNGDSVRVASLVQTFSELSYGRAVLENEKERKSSFATLFTDIMEREEFKQSFM